MNLLRLGLLAGVAWLVQTSLSAQPAASRGHPLPERTTPLPPAEAARSFTVPDDLEIEPVLAEPVVRQPVFLNFDERGRIWVVQYLQYPAPAGLKVVSKDVFWRAVYDKVPEPPPRGVKGRDKITIHEDTDGDGVFDRHKTFVDGLNIATACVKGRGGVWVLNPPYLLFYPDKNDDDVPDGDPVIHLEGFGLEDTHSVVNSLRWGPDGWLYAAQGSTVTAKVRVVAPRSRDTNRVFHSQGQNIWRYHPEKHLYEIFAEGGGNAFGVEFDDQGRLFSGHNGGDTRGFHYMQGAYLRKGFEKHGELSNPYAFGYFPQMDGTKGERFTHNFILYHGGTLPARYDGKLFGIEPLQGRVVLSEITPDGSTFKTRDLERVVTSSDSWFRPVDIKTGPDGAIYIADWHDRQVTHTRNQEGLIDRETGRIYRLKRKGAKPIEPFNLAKLSSRERISFLASTNQWFRQMALRLQHERPNELVALELKQMLKDLQLSGSLESFWTLAAGNDSSLVRDTLSHADPFVRGWAVRLCGDDTPAFRGTVSAGSLIALAARETNVEVRAQLACTARRLPADDCLPIINHLLHHDEDARDPRLPLLCWWAIEAKCESDRDAVLKLFEDSPLWNRPMVGQHLLARLMRRFAASGTRRDLLTCARLLELAPSRQHAEILMKGFEEAFKGRSLSGLPDALTAGMARHAVGSDAFKLRVGDARMLKTALQTIADSKAPRQRRQEFIDVLGEIHPPTALPALLQVADHERDLSLRQAALSALAEYNDPRVPVTVLKDFIAYSAELRSTALALLGSRAAWSLELVRAVAAGKITPADVPLDAIRRMQRHSSDELAALILRHWPKAGRPSTAQMEEQIQRLAGVLQSGPGDPYAGKKLFTASCAACHRLFHQGGQIGPDLTSYQRGDLGALLLHVVNPSAEIREGYEGVVIETRDDRSLTGFLVERDPRTLVLRGLDGRNVTLEEKDVREMKAAGLSLMPEGLLDGMTDQEARDLFAYLRSTQPLAN